MRLYFEFNLSISASHCCLVFVMFKFRVFGLLLKEVLPALLPSITTIMNTSLKLGVFVQKWKVAAICPLLKKAGLEIIPKNYRPVSNLSFLSKVLEQCVLIRFNEHCDNHSLLPNYQSAYRPNYGCETSLLKIINDMLWAMERKSITAMVVMDLSAAFNTAIMIYY